MITYLGRPGTALIALARSPGLGMPRTALLGAHVHRLLDGSAAVDRAPRSTRTWVLDWKLLSAAERRDIVALADGQYGPGPFVLLDPSTTNLLTANQASGTDKGQSTSGFTVAGGETLASSTAQAVRGSRSLRWSLPAAVTSGILTLAAPPSLSAWAVPATEPWTFAGSLRGGGADPIVDVQLALRWLDASLAQVSETLGAVVTLGAGGWSPASVSAATPPAGAVYLVPRVKVAAASVTATADVYLDELRLTMTNTAQPWTPGEGQPLVSITEMPESVPMVGLRDLSVTLVEVG